MKKGNSLLGAESGPGKYGGLSEPGLRLSKRQTALKRRKGKNAVCVGVGRLSQRGRDNLLSKRGRRTFKEKMGYFLPES